MKKSSCRKSFAFQGVQHADVKILKLPSYFVFLSGLARAVAYKRGEKNGQ
jgi:hypothetical protein